MVSDNDSVWRRGDGSRWRMSVVPGSPDVGPSRMILSPWGVESEGSGVEAQVFQLAGVVPDESA